LTVTCILPCGQANVQSNTPEHGHNAPPLPVGDTGPRQGTPETPQIPNRDQSVRCSIASTNDDAGAPTPSRASSGFFGSATTTSASVNRSARTSRTLPTPSTSPSSAARLPSHTSPSQSCSSCPVGASSL